MQKKKVIIIGSVSIFVVFVYCFATIASLKSSIRKADIKKKQELALKVSQEKELIKKDFEERYRADRVSYKAMAKRLEMERQKAKELEAEVEAQKKETAKKKKSRKKTTRKRRRKR